MIDWLSVFFNTLWIGGLAIVLAAFSYHQWLAGETACRFRDVLSQPSWKLPFFAGLSLTCVGLGYDTAERLWEKTVWTALAISFGWQFVMTFRQSRKKAAR